MSTKADSRCRICFYPSSAGLGEMLTPCFCRGVFAFVHQKCLTRWLEETGSETCDICRFKYKMVKSPKGFVDWLLEETEERNDVIATFAALLFLIYLLLLGFLMWTYSIGKIHLILSLLLLGGIITLGGFSGISTYRFVLGEMNMYREWARSSYRIQVMNNPEVKLEPETPPRKVTRSSGLTSGSSELNYKSSSSSEGF